MLHRFIELVKFLASSFNSIASNRSSIVRDRSGHPKNEAEEGNLLVTVSINPSYFLQQGVSEERDF
jgi:hypothetical protein